MASKKNTKWVIFGSIIFVLAVLIAVGPILLTKYMRAKWQDAPKYSTSSLLIKVEGKLLLSEDEDPYLLGNNGLYYLLEDLSEGNIENYLNKDCFVLGKIISANPNEYIGDNDVRMIISVDEINDISTSGANESIDDINISQKLEEKTAKRNKLVIETNIALNKPILFDVIKGKLSLQNRERKNGEEVSAVILTDEFGDNYLLRVKDKLFNNVISDKEVICLGREVLPLKDMFLVVDEINFEIYEIYDTDYNKLF